MHTGTVPTNGIVPPQVTLDVATLARLEDLQVRRSDQTQAAKGRAIIASGTETLLRVSRRDGGLLHKVGTLESSDGRGFAILYVVADDELHGILIPVADDDIRGFMRESVDAGLKVLFIDSAGGDMRMMVASSSSELSRLLLKAPSAKHAEDVCGLAAELAEAARYAASREVVAQLWPEDGQPLRHVYINTVLPASEVTAVRQMQQPTLQ